MEILYDNNCDLSKMEPGQTFKVGDYFYMKTDNEMLSGHAEFSIDVNYITCVNLSSGGLYVMHTSTKVIPIRMEGVIRE